MNVASGPAPLRGSHPPPLLEIDAASKEYPVRAGLTLRRHGAVVHAVSDVSLTVSTGETLGLVGESGCGKSTLARLIVALEAPTRGVVRIDGQPLLDGSRDHRRARRREVQLMFQDPDSSLDPRMRVGASVAEPLVVHHVGERRQRSAAVARLFEEVGLRSDLVDRYPHELSGGQRQRVGLARALALRPRLVVADEPVSALDVSVQAQVLNLLRQVRDEHGLTLVLISHDLAVVRYLADRVGVMYLGALVELGPVDDVYRAPAHPYTAGLVATIPKPTVAARHRRDKPAIQGELPSAVDPPSGCRFRTRCPRAQARCAAETPPTRPVAAGHQVACHFPLRPPLSDAD